MPGQPVVGDQAAGHAQLGVGGDDQPGPAVGSVSCGLSPSSALLDHGPYWQWTAEINGKTVTRRLSRTEATLYQQWIDNDRQLRALISQMRQVAAQATELIRKDAASSLTVGAQCRARNASPRARPPSCR